MGINQTVSLQSLIPRHLLSKILYLCVEISSKVDNHKEEQQQTHKGAGISGRSRDIP